MGKEIATSGNKIRQEQFVHRTGRIINESGQILLRFCCTKFIELITFEVHVWADAGFYL